MDDEEHILNDTWTMYFHEPSDSNWTMASYVRLEQISSVEAFWRVHEGTKKFLSRGMFFLMREHVFPCWDDPNNIDGGCISIKVLKEDIGTFWEEVAVRMLGESLVKKNKVEPRPRGASGSDDVDAAWSLVNGVSTSPKRYFCIAKIWLRKGVLLDKANFAFPACYHGEPLYRSNMDNIRQNSS